MLNPGRAFYAATASMRCLEPCGFLCPHGVGHGGLGGDAARVQAETERNSQVVGIENTVKNVADGIDAGCVESRRQDASRVYWIEPQSGIERL